MNAAAAFLCLIGVLELAILRSGKPPSWFLVAAAAGLVVACVAGVAALATHFVRAEPDGQ